MPTQPVMDRTCEHPVTTVNVDVFRSMQATHFDDDGESCGYAHGAYFLQRLATQRTGDTARNVTLHANATQ